MLKAIFSVPILAYGVLGAVSSGLAEESSPTPASGRSTRTVTPSSIQGMSLVDRLDSFGQKILDTIRPNEGQWLKTGLLFRSAKKESDGRRDAAFDSASQPNQGSRTWPPRSTSGAEQRRSEKTRSTGGSDEKTRQTSPKVVSADRPRSFRATSPKVVSADKPHNSRATSSEVVSADRPRNSRAVEPAGLSVPASPGLVPLHERMKSFRQSAFADGTQRKPVAKAPTGFDSLVPKRSEEVPNRLEASSNTPTPAKRDGPAAKSQSSPTGMASGLPIRSSAEGPTPSRRDSPRIAATDGLVTPRRAATKAETTEVAADPDTSAPARTTDLTATTEPPAGRGENLLFAHKSPVLSVETVGPRRISVGKQSTYELTINNSGEVAAEELVVLVDLPEWADVVDVEASAGTTHSTTPGEVARPSAAAVEACPSDGRLRWNLGRLEAKSREKLLLKVVPRESRPFDLAVRWDYTPVASQAMIEVQEPKLVIHLEGPREVLYGEKEIYQLKLSNTGTGNAENVVITLMPTGTGDSQPVSHNLGIVEAGREKSVEVELTARQAGRLMIKVQVQGDAGVQAELAEEILVRRAALELDVEGPTMQYVGTAASYRIRVDNPGTAPAKQVKLAVKLPPGAKYLSGVDGSRLGANGSEVQWMLDRLDAGSEKVFVVKCSLGLPGSARVEVLSTADGELSTSANTTTQVEAIADLRLEMKDPAGPIPVGEETTYELRIRNRGTKNAQGVEVVAYFSRGIEPLGAEGPRHRISPGQVVFSPIPSLAAGEDIVLKIRARAEAPGNHVFRAEVHCKPLGTRLVSEETTRFYQAGHVPPEETGIAAGQDTSPSAAERPQTVDRQEATSTPRNARRTTPTPPRR